MPVRRWSPPILWAAFTFTLTSIPRVDRYVPHLFPGADKIVHATLYLVLAALLVRAWAPPRARAASSLVAVLVGIMLVGWADEWHQQFIPGRSQDTADWLADVVGGSIGILTAETARRRREPGT